MSSLRRDLVERKLWMVVAILVVAVVGAPVFLLKGASASTTPTVPAPPKPLLMLLLKVSLPVLPRLARVSVPPVPTLIWLGL